MKNAIALVGDLSSAQYDAWLSALSKQLPDEQIVRFEQLSTAQKQDCEIAIVANPSPSDIAQLPNLIWLHSLWAGVEKLVAKFKGQSLKIVRLQDPLLSATMSEAVLTWCLYLHRDMHIYRSQQMQQQWQAADYKKPKQRTIGVLGLGVLGRVSAQRLTDNGFKVLGWSRNPKTIDNVTCLHSDSGLTDILCQSDILVILLPLTNETNQLLNSERLKLLKPNASIINFARGGIIDHQALIQGLDSNSISHAVLDVFDQEPLPKNSPLWQNPNITVLPHISAQTDMESASNIVANNIKTYRKTKKIPKHIDFKKGY
jgi:glyoxylate/hydroxypyruvate reductase A